MTHSPALLASLALLAFVGVGYLFVNLCASADSEMSDLETIKRRYENERN
jgi:hypothetical protein